MIKRAVVFAAIVFLFACGNAAANPILLNFDTDLNGNPISNGTPIGTAYPQQDIGATFSANSIILLGGGGVTSQPNFASGTPLFTGVIEIIFDGLASFVEAQNVTNSGFTLTVFDANNNVIGSASAPFGSFPFLVNVTVPGIKRATFTTSAQEGGQYGIDDLRFEQVIPEPTTLVLCGLVGAGLVAYRLRRRTAIA